MAAETVPANTKAREFELVGGSPCLDFVNTLDDRPSDHQKELLNNYADLVAFAEQSGLLKSKEAKSLLERAATSPREARESLRKTIDLREAMYGVFWAIEQKSKVPEESLAALNGHIQESAGHAEFVRANGTFESRFDDAGSLHRPRWALARSAAELLSSGDRLQFIRACSSPTCQWLFLDTSKNHQRRWCDMRLCGNRDKVRRFYARKRENAE